MKITPKYKLSIFATCLLFAGLYAQERKSKLSEKLNVNNDVVVNLNTSHTKVVFESWNKNTVAIEAFVEGDHINPEMAKHLLDSWQVDVSGNSREVTIKSITNSKWNGTITASNIRMGEDLQQLKIMSPMIADILGPYMENIANNPMPNALSEDVATVNLGGKKNTEKEEKYLQQWENQINEKLGNTIDAQKEQLIKQLAKNSPNVSGQMEIRFEAWGEQYGRQMEAWASQFVKEAQNQQGTSGVTVYSYRATTTPKRGANGINKVIKINIPKNANLRLNVRHGGVQLAEKTNNMIASLSHTKLEANVVDGENTYIKASYSPVFVQQWNNGKLVINYVKNCRIQSANNLQVNADSSNIFVQQLNDNGSITGSFGAITIANLGESFSTLDLAVENSDFKLKLPKTSFSLVYSGAQSRIALPKTLETNVRRNFGTVFVNGFQGTRNTDKAITINAKYSDVVLQ